VVGDAHRIAGVAPQPDYPRIDTNRSEAMSAPKQKARPG
jgi:hypothetical protein